ncbi:hypothetical protein FM106_08080 [Brachybacterium faecium]|nr:hypothetical protein FM106_08080 [Brachybacterium faecium]
MIISLLCPESSETELFTPYWHIKTLYYAKVNYANKPKLKL